MMMMKMMKMMTMMLMIFKNWLFQKQQHEHSGPAARWAGCSDWETWNWWESGWWFIIYHHLSLFIIIYHNLSLSWWYWWWLWWGQWWVWWWSIGLRRDLELVWVQYQDVECWWWWAWLLVLMEKFIFLTAFLKKSHN